MAGMPKQKYELTISYEGSEKTLMWMQNNFASFVYTGIQFHTGSQIGNGATLGEECFHLCQLYQANPPTDMAQRPLRLINHHR